MLLHNRKRNTLLSIGVSTLLYMVMLRLGMQEPYRIRKPPGTKPEDPAGRAASEAEMSPACVPRLQQSSPAFRVVPCG